jgi:hypothetical protein
MAWSRARDVAASSLLARDVAASSLLARSGGEAGIAGINEWAVYQAQAVHIRYFRYAPPLPIAIRLLWEAPHKLGTACLGYSRGPRNCRDPAHEAGPNLLGRMMRTLLRRRRLRPFGIRPGDVHAGDGEARRSFKGYAAKSIKEACERYISQNTPLPSAPPRRSRGNKDLVDNQTAPQKNGGADGNESNPMESNELRGGADENPQNGDACECADDLLPGDRGNSATGGPDENEAAPEQSDRSAARRIVAKAQDLGIPLFVRNGELMREAGWADEGLLSEIREHRAEIIAELQGDWGAA